MGCDCVGVRGEICGASRRQPGLSGTLPLRVILDIGSPQSTCREAMGDVHAVSVPAMISGQSDSWNDLAALANTCRVLWRMGTRCSGGGAQRLEGGRQTAAANCGRPAVGGAIREVLGLLSQRWRGGEDELTS